MGSNIVVRKLFKKTGIDISPSRTGDDVLMPDNDIIYLGTGKDGELFHDGTNTYFQNNTGGIVIENDAQDGDITFKVNDGGVDTTVMTIDGATGNVGIGTTDPKSTLDVSGNVSLKVVSKTSAYTAASEAIILCDATGGAFSVTLPAATNSTGRVYYIKKTDSSTNAITVDGNASETIDGLTTQTINNQYDCIQIVCDGSAWYIL